MVFVCLKNINNKKNNRQIREQVQRIKKNIKKKVTLCNDRGWWRSVHTIEGGLGTPNAHDGGTKEEKE